MVELLSVACLSVACKLDEVSIPSLHDLQVRACTRVCTCYSTGRIRSTHFTFHHKHRVITLGMHIYRSINLNSQG
jgi:hypothetical protein